MAKTRKLAAILATDVAGPIKCGVEIVMEFARRMTMRPNVWCNLNSWEINAAASAWKLTSKKQTL
jgi:hypothetical protein